MAVDDLRNAHLQWGGHLNQLITNRYRYTDFAGALGEHGADEIKVVLEWAS
jgi:hypothetical protein